ncbi:MAG TPA: DUF664 domain-containing protein [Dongiaceae bacterium]|nr:DUF664 domain-containing protein [Dongiaceae bacterium]
MTLPVPAKCLPNRRNFLKLGAAAAAGFSGLAAVSLPAVAQSNDAWIVGPQPGYTPEVGTLVSMLHVTRIQVLHNVQGLSVADLDFLLDSKANTIGALLNHLAATDAFYHANCFGGFSWEKMPADVKQKWGVAMNLGEPARQAIKGHSLDYYLNLLNETRERTLAELKKRDDKWLTVMDTDAGANNYAKWFHVAEHESNHDGQIKLLKSRVPGAKPAAE